MPSAIIQVNDKEIYSDFKSIAKSKNKSVPDFMVELIHSEVNKWRLKKK